MKKINLFVSLVFLFLLTILASFVSGAVISPANSATVSGATVLLNATNTSLPNMLNCTFYTFSSLTANSSWVNLGVATNESGNALNVNRTFDSTTLEDANNYQFNATCRNSSNSQTSSVGTATVTIDNTIPQAPTSLTPTSDTDGSVDFSSTVTGRNTTSCTLLFVSTNPGQTSYAMTHSGSTCTYTHSSMPEQSYQYYVRASDETNTTDSSVTTLNVDIKTGAGKSMSPQQVKQAERQRALSISGTGFSQDIGGLPIWGWILIIGVVGIVGYKLYKK